MTLEPETSFPTGPRRAGSGRRFAVGRAGRAGAEGGYTLLELIVTLAVIATLLGIFAPGYLEYLRRTKLTRAVVDIRLIEADIRIWGSGQDFPDSLDELDSPQRFDPWGRPYQYLRIDPKNRGRWRKDRFLVPLNSDYDLYSFGPDGESRPPLTARSSRDDVVRAGDGAYVGWAEDY